MIRKMIEEWKQNRGKKAVAKAIAVLATAPRAAVSIPTKQAFFDNNDTVKVVIQDSLNILVHRGDIEVVTDSGTIKFWGDMHRPYLQADGELASAPLFTAYEIVHNICAKIGIQATDPGGEVFCITMYNHVFHDNLSWDDAKKAAESMESVIRDAASVLSAQPLTEMDEQAAGYFYSFLCLIDKEDDKNMRKTALTTAISEAADALRVESGAQQTREFLIMLARGQHPDLQGAANLEEEKW